MGRGKTRQGWQAKEARRCGDPELSSLARGGEGLRLEASRRICVLRRALKEERDKEKWRHGGLAGGSFGCKGQQTVGVDDSTGRPKGGRVEPFQGAGD